MKHAASPSRTINQSLIQQAIKESSIQGLQLESGDTINIVTSNEIIKLYVTDLDETVIRGHLLEYDYQAGKEAPGEDVEIEVKNIKYISVWEQQDSELKEALGRAIKGFPMIILFLGITAGLLLVVL